MPLTGQASGGWTESSSALRLLNVNFRNSIGVLTDDAFTQTNPPLVATNVSSRVNQTKTGVQSGSVAFTRPFDGENYVGGVPASLAGMTHIQKLGTRPLGVFINSANGNAYENTPGVASGVGPYVSGMGTFGNALYETKVIASVGGDPAEGSALSYVAGSPLIASKNGYLMPRYVIAAAGTLVDADLQAVSANAYITNGVVGGGNSTSTIIGVLKMAPDAVQTELVYDQRI